IFEQTRSCATSLGSVQWSNSGWDDMNDIFPKSDRVDIMLLLEGTFPYVSGGVSSWVNQIIRGFPEYRFGAIFLGSRRDDYSDMKYELPGNLVHLETAYLQESQERPEVEAQAGNIAAFEVIKRLHASFLKPDPSLLDNKIKDINFYLDPSS